MKDAVGCLDGGQTGENPGGGTQDPGDQNSPVSDAAGTPSEGPSDAIQRMAQQYPPAHRRQYLRAVAGKSRAAAMKTFCLSCVGFVAADVRRCGTESCPLHAYRTR